MTQQIPTKARVMIASAVVFSLGAVAAGLKEHASQSWTLFPIVLAAAVLASRFKVKLPGMTTTMSGSLPVILYSILHLGLLGSLAVGAAAGLTQSLSSSGQKARPVQMLFNACALLNATALGYWMFHYQALQASTAAHMLALALASAVYFLANTTPIAAIVSLVEGSNAMALWHKVFLWSFPNYVIGAGLAAIASAFSSAAGWAAMTAIIAVLFGVYQSYKLFVGRSELAQPKPMSMAAGAR
jgi:hypothetical protein